MANYEEIRANVIQRIDEVEKAVQNLQTVRKTLLLHAYEAKQSILSAFSHQQDSMRSREIFLLNKVDSTLQSKDDALITQLAKLNQVLGCLRNCLQGPHPCGECLEKFDDIDMVPIEECDMNFTSSNDVLREAIHSFGQLDYDNKDVQTTDASGDGSGNRLAWLMSPTNVQKTPVDRKEELLGAQIEWLVQRHPSKPRKGEEIGDHFLAIKSQMRDAWLSAKSRDQTHSLYAYVMNEFKKVTQDTLGDWLCDETALEAQSECSEATVTSGATSSLQSSCVVIRSRGTSTSSVVVVPDNPTSERGNQWLNFKPTSMSPPLTGSNISDWIDSCDTENKCQGHPDEWLHSNTVSGKLSLPISFTNCNEWLSSESIEAEYVELAESTTSAEWLSPAQPSSVFKPDQWLHATSTASPPGNWLSSCMASPCFTEEAEQVGTTLEQDVDDEWLSQKKPHVTTEDQWLCVPVKMPTSDNWEPSSLKFSRSVYEKDGCTQDQEKIDVSAEKMSELDWLASPSSTPRKSDKNAVCWLRNDGEMKDDKEDDDEWLVPKLYTQDNPANYCKMVANNNQEWLVVMEHLNRIVISKDSEWLMEGKTDNRFAEKQDDGKAFTRNFIW